MFVLKVPVNNATNTVNNEQTASNGFNLQVNTAQYKGSDYSNAVRVEREITLEKAFEIAKNDPEIDYFVYTKGYSMVLEIPAGIEPPANDPLGLVSYERFQFDNGDDGRGYCRVFKEGDVVFFKNEGKWLGTATGLADVYSKS